MQKVRVGIIGLGTAAESFHIPILASFDDVEIVAAVDVNVKQRSRAKRKWNIQEVYESDAEMYDNSNLDAVFICAPNFLHEQITRDALKQDRHVFCEKPFGLPSDKAYELGKIASDRNLTLTVGYNKRLGQNYEKAARIVGGMRLGRVTHVNGVFLTRGPYAGYTPKGDWFLEERGGGVLYDMGSHLFDLITHILSQRVDRVSALSANVLHLNTIDNIAGLFQTERQALGTFHTGWQAATDQNPSLQIHGTGGSLSVDSHDIVEMHGSHDPIDKIVCHMRSTSRIVRKAIRNRSKEIDETYIKEDRAFIDSVKGVGKPLVKIDEAIHVLEVLEAIKESAKKKMPCEVIHHPSIYQKHD